MNPRHATLKPPPRMPEAPRPRQETTASTWPARTERRQDLRGEIRDESEHFEHLLDTLGNLDRGLLADFGGAGFQEPQQQNSGSSADSAAAPEQRDIDWWQALLERLEQHLDDPQPGVLEAHLELPNLGPVKVNVIHHGAALEIAVHMAPDAWRQVEPLQQTSAAWLARQLGRAVRLRLHREGV